MSGTRRNLLIARVGRGSVHPGWLEDCPERDWDLQLSSYVDDEGLYADDGDLPLSIDMGTKFDSIHRYLTAHPEVFDRYEYICLPDDDLVISGRDIDRALAICREFDLLLAQPSQTWGSYNAHAILLNAPQFRLRFTNFVEAQWPCFRSDYLRELLPFLENRFSGWGIDLVWGLLMSEPWERCAVIDEVSMLHGRPVYGGDMYGALTRLRVDHKRELSDVLGAYENPPRRRLVYGAVTPDGRRVGAARARAVNGAHLVRRAGRTHKTVRTACRGVEMLSSAITHVRYRARPLVPVTRST